MESCKEFVSGELENCKESDRVRAVRSLLGEL